MGGAKKRRPEEAEEGDPAVKRLRVTIRRPKEDAARDSSHLDEWSDEEGERTSYSFLDLALKPDHRNRPVWVTPDRRVFLESFSPLYRQAYDFLIAIAEPVSRPQCVHEYMLTAHSLYAAVSIGLDADTIVKVLGKLSKVSVSKSLADFVHVTTQNCGKLKLVIQDNKFLLESPYPEVLREIVKDEVIAKAVKDKSLLARILGKGEGAEAAGGGGQEAGAAADFIVKKDVGKGKVADEITAIDLEGDEIEEIFDERGGGKAAERGGGFTHAIEILPSMIEHVKQRCLPGSGSLNYPILEEYDFQNDKKNPDLLMELKPTAKLRSYQQKSLSKMFSNGRARSGVIVLPCGAGKSLTGVAAASRVKKSIICLCLNSVSVDQWRHQFLLWTNLQEHQVTKFTAENKQMFATDSGVLVTTYSMLTHEGRRSEEASRILREMQSKEWGLMLLDEVHVVPAETFRKVIAIVKSHCKLGLTATLVREDNLIDHLNFLIGPKLYEANWLDLVSQGYLANVQCAEVWCEMTKEFFAEYLKKDNRRRRELLYVMNPIKFMTCQFLIEYHEQHRRDKVIVFSDNIFALREYAMKLRRPFIYGATAHNERTRILHHFKHSSEVNTIFISRVGDNSIDIPEANVIIQIASHAGARRQEAQRLGRILRPKQSMAIGSGNTGEFNAFFYSLVSKDTQEMFYSTKRQQFLIDQGYAFKVVTGLLDNMDKAEYDRLSYSKREDQIDLLSRILTVGEADQGDEVLATDKEQQIQEKNLLSAARRNVSSLAGLSGARGMTYMEYQTGTQPKQLSEAQKRRNKINPYKERHHLFKFRKKYQR
ncbi:DNA repair helicase Rad25 [Chloropicon primus]|uniref:DNA 3'-5' helicase n=2 Tax=Chloropicon primus TaxID=1764295 RepID=A0A5B8MZH9_9CHLO|nr:DNA repair helicase Rad25 [Chloropicon primus]UPR04662.1 DNA repair helicase Rad25 [Chloropicon primus]|eukprot:QDZ25466.1 DNA repair helicase Rad25 [Chloropicon primus]